MQQNHLDIDSKNFDPQRYVTHYLKYNSIQDLINKNNDVQNEVKNFDQEIQNLVFENYSQFISSIDTVKKMKTDIFQVDDKMRVLEKSMERISNLTEKIDNSLKTKRDEIQKLEIVNTDLQKLNSLIEFPQILEKELKAFKQARLDNQELDFSKQFNKSIEDYKICFNMLSQFKEEPLVKPIYADSIDKIDELRSILWNFQNQYKKIENFDYMMLQESDEKAQILLENEKFKHKQFKYISQKLIVITEDKESVLRNYLKIIKDKLIYKTKVILDFQLEDEQISSIEDQVFEIFKEKEYQMSLNEIQQQKQQIEQNYIQNSQQKVGSLIYYINKLQQFIFEDLKDEITFLFKDLQQDLDENRTCQDLVDNTLKEIILGILETLSSKLNEYNNNSNIDINECFYQLDQNIKEIIVQNELIKRNLKAEVQQKFNESIEQICKGQILKGFNNLRIKSILSIIEVKKQCYEMQISEENINIDDQVQKEAEIKKKIFEYLTNFKNQITCYTNFAILDNCTLIFKQNYLPNLENFLSLFFAQCVDFIKSLIKLLTTGKHKFSKEILQQVNTAILNKQFKQTFLQQQTNQKLEIDFMRVFDELLTQEKSSFYFIFVNQILTIFKQQMIHQIIQNIQEETQNNIGLITKQDPLIQSTYNQYIQTLKSSEQNRLQLFINDEIVKNGINYSQYHAQNLIKQNLKNYFTLNLQYKEKDVTDISEQIESIALVLKRIILELSIIFPDVKRGFSKKASFLKFEADQDVEMQKMLVKKLHNYKQDVEEINRYLLLTAIYNTFLKSIIECIRINLKGVNSNTYSQLFTDIYFIIQLIYESVQVDDENLIIAFFSEIIDIAQKKAFEKTLSKQQLQSLAETICQAKRNKLKI